LAFTVITLAGSLPALGLQNSLRRFISYHAERGEPGPVRALVTFGLVWPAASGIVLGGLLFALSVPLAEQLFGKAELAPLLRALALVVPLSAERKLATVVFSGFKRPSLKVLVEDLVEPLLRVAGAAGIAAAGLGVLQLAHASTLAYVVVGVLSIALVRSALAVAAPRGPAAAGLPWRGLVAFGSPLVVSDLVELLLAWISVLLLGVLSVEHEVGLFRSASQPPMLAGAILTSFGFVYLPVATELFVRGDRESWKRINNAVAHWTLSLSFPIAAVCLLFPAEVIRLLFGAEYLDGAATMRWLAAGYLFRAGCGLTGLNLVAAGLTRLHMLLTLGGFGVAVAASIVWIPTYGAAGAAAAYALSVSSRALANVVATRVTLGLSPFQSRWTGLVFVHLLSVAAVAALIEFSGLSGVAAPFVLGALELPVALGIAVALGLLGRADLEAVAVLRRGRTDGR
jgi:O-antigen/teichoic acid export membrane protein